MAHLKADNDHQWNMSAQLAPEFEYDQRIAWGRANFSRLGCTCVFGSARGKFSVRDGKFLPFRVRVRRNPGFLGVQRNIWH